MKADPRVIADLITSAGTLATMVEQFRIDRLALCAVDCKWLAAKFGKWYEQAEDHLEEFVEAIIAFEGNPAYTVGKLQGGDEALPAVLERTRAFTQAAFDAFCAARAKAYTIRADYTPDDYEHAIKFLQKVITKTEAQLRLIQGIGPGQYVAGRLEDE